MTDDEQRLRDEFDRRDDRLGCLLVIVMAAVIVLTVLLLLEEVGR